MELTKMEVEVIRVALPRNQRGHGKPFPGHKKKVIGIMAINQYNTKRNPEGGYKKLGDQGYMTVEDFENKRYSRYGLKEYFDNLGKAELTESVISQNSELQETVMSKDAEIQKLKDQLAALESAKKKPEVKKEEVK